LRTGGKDSQQNANITFIDFDDNPANRLKVLADRYWLACSGKVAGIEAGRMPFPFFTPNEYFWDGDISPLGFAGHAAIDLSDATRLKLTAGSFALPAGPTGYSGALIGGQAVLGTGPVTLATGLFRFDADPGDPDGSLLLDGNGERDYTVLAVNAQYRLPALGNALVFGADLYRNLENYGKAGHQARPAGNGQRTGFVLSATWGDTSKPGHWKLGYRYFRMEKFAVNASYAHDDVARFGTAAQASLTDLRGHDVEASYAIAGPLTVAVRMMAVERLTSIEDGKRARLDLVYSF